MNVLSLLEKTDLSKKDIFSSLGVSSQYKNYRDKLGPLIVSGLISPTIKDKPNSPKQKYTITELGISYLKYLKESK